MSDVPSQSGEPGASPPSLGDSVSRLLFAEAGLTHIVPDAMERGLRGADAGDTARQYIREAILPAVDGMRRTLGDTPASASLSPQEIALLSRFVEERERMWRLLAEGTADPARGREFGRLRGATEPTRDRLTRAQQGDGHAWKFQEFFTRVHALTPRIYVTPLLVAANVGVLLFLMTRGVSPTLPDPLQMLDWGANYAPRTLSGEAWRIPASMFLHFGVIHLGMNMLALWNVGRLVERLTGAVGFLIMYLAAGIGGALASLWWNPGVISAGASGAVFGVLGALLGYVLPRRDTIPMEVLSHFRSTVFGFLAFNLLFGLSVTFIDNAAHLGGFGVGTACGLLLSRPLTREMVRRRWRRNVLTALIAGAAAAAAFQALPPAGVDLF